MSTRVPLVGGSDETNYVQVLMKAKNKAKQGEGLRPRAFRVSGFSTGGR